MAVTYCTSQDVANIIWRAGTGADFTASSNPTKDFVEDLINAAEDTIDGPAGANRSWRSTLVTDEIRKYIRNDAYRGRRWWAYRGKVFLNHRSVRTFVSGTHKIEIWDGSAWVDLIAGAYTEGRAADYWLDYNQGIIYFVNTYPHEIEQGVRCTYAYGEATVPSDIRFACAKMVAIELMRMDDRSILLPEGSSNISLDSKVEMWSKDVERTFGEYTEIVSV
jgi:hypothetical protein